jgi:hypothetical protein
MNSLVLKFHTPKTIRRTRDRYYRPAEVWENINNLIAFPFISAKLILDVSVIKWQTETSKSLFLWSESEVSPQFWNLNCGTLWLPVVLLEGQFGLHLSSFSSDVCLVGKYLSFPLFSFHNSHFSLKRDTKDIQIRREELLLEQHKTETAQRLWWSSDLVPKIAGSNPAEAVGFFGRQNPQHAFLRRGSKAVCPMSQLCGMLKNPTMTWKSHCSAKFDREFLAHNTSFRY